MFSWIKRRRPVCRVDVLCKNIVRNYNAERRRQPKSVFFVVVDYCSRLRPLCLGGLDSRAR